MGKQVDHLHRLIKLKQQFNLHFLWMTDPMHANTELINNFKTRRLSNIITELTQVVQILKYHNQILAGIHLEATPFHVNECIHD